MNVLDVRRAGVLLHITSLPPSAGWEGEAGGESALGDFGGARQFFDFLFSAGITVWQLLPLGPTHKDLSPYLCTSSLAGNPQIIDLQWLRNVGWLSKQLLPAQFSSVRDYRIACLKEAFTTFKMPGKTPYFSSYQRFAIEHDSWLADFALFTALSRSNNGLEWMFWPSELRDRNEKALAKVSESLDEEIEQVKFEQYIFYTQWFEIRAHARQLGIKIMGDMPLFVAHDSAEVWANRRYFKVDEEGRAKVVAGVPPDYFSAAGQKWGSPVYDWGQLQDDGFEWWIRRLQSQLELYDLVRIDHFRGLQACWEIPADADSAVAGMWKNTPGAELLQTLQNKFGDLPLVAEDLGFITQEVHDLREHFQLPGMKVMQFAFDGGSDNPYLLSKHITNCVAYTGTHDNDTSLGWYKSLSKDVRKDVDRIINCPELTMPWAFIDHTFSSVARLVIIPMQDILELGESHRLNTPGTINCNWRWQFSWEQVPSDLPERLRRLVERHRRKPDLL